MEDKGFWSEKNVLITGGTSFVGKNLANKLRGLGAKPFTFGSDKFDLATKEGAEKAFQTSKYDFIIHMAALQNAADWPMYHTGIQFHVNSLIHVNSIEAWRKFQPQAKFIGVGSSCSYPGEIEVLKEEDYDKGKLHESVWAYGFTKKLMSVGIEAYKKQYGLKGTTAIFGTLYGPYDDFDLKTAHVVGALISKFCDAKKQGISEVEVWGDGNQTRELIYVEDQLDGLLMIAQNYDGKMLNLGTGIQTTITDLAEKIKEISRYPGKIVYNTNKFVGVIHKVLNISKAKREIGWTEENKMHSLEQGLKKTIDWYEESFQK